VIARGFWADPATLDTEHEAWSNGGGCLDVAMYYSGWLGPSDSTNFQRLGFRINGPAAVAALGKGFGTSYTRPMS
jgi:hypothetical protein